MASEAMDGMDPMDGMDTRETYPKGDVHRGP